MAPRKGQIVTVAATGWICDCGLHGIRLEEFCGPVPSCRGTRCSTCWKKAEGEFWYASRFFAPLDRSTAASREIVEKWKQEQLESEQEILLPELEEA
jgi:hypothetical protein